MPRQPATLGLALAAVAWAYIPSNDRLSWRDSVYLPQLTMLIAVAILAHVASRRQAPGQPDSPHSAAITAALALAALSTVRSVDPAFAVMYVGELLSLYAMARWLHGSRVSARTACGTMVVVVLTLVAYAAGEIAGVVPSLGAAAMGPGATLGNRNVLARCAAMALPGAWCLASTGAPARRRCWAIAASLLLAAVIVSRCRVAWLAGIAALTVACILLAVDPPERRWRCRRRLVSSITIILSASIMSRMASTHLAWSDRAWFASTARRLALVTSGSGAVRAAQASAIARIVAQDPMLGRGPAPLVSLDLSANAGGYNTFASSDVTGFLVAFGALPVLLLGGALTIDLVRAVPRSRPLRHVSMWATTAAVVTCAIGDATLQLPFSGAVAVIGIGAWLPRSRQRVEPERSRIVQLSFIAMLIVLLIGALAASDQVLRTVAVATDVSLPRIVPASMRPNEPRSIGELRQRWIMHRAPAQRP